MGKVDFLSLDFDRKPMGVASAKQDVRAASPARQGRSGGQTNHSLSGCDPLGLRPPTTYRLPNGSEVSCRVLVC